MGKNAYLESLTTQLAEKNLEAKSIADSFAVDEKGRFSVTTEQHQAYRAAIADARELKSLIDDMTTQEQIGQFLDAPAGVPAAAAYHGSLGTEVKTLADVFIESDAFQAQKERSYEDPGRIRAGLEGKSIFNFAAGTVEHQALGPAVNLGIAEMAKRKAHIRDLFPKSSTSASVLYGVRETGWVNNAKQIRQRYAADGTSDATGLDSDVFGKAPKSKITLVPVTYPVAEIAHTLDAHKNILADEGRLRTFLNTRMVDGVKYAEDFDLLHAIGNAEEVTGLYNTPGVQSYTGLATDKLDVQVRRAITQALLAEYEPTGIVISPTRFEEIEVEEGSDGHLRVAVSVAIGSEKRIWRLNVVETTAMDDVNFVVGAFGMGAQLHDREMVSVSVSTENADNFERGVVTFRASERVAFEVPRPESFVIGTWTEPA